jgi:hypothetical protein
LAAGSNSVGSIADQVGFGISYEKKLKSTSSRVGLDEVGFDFDFDELDMIWYIEYVWGLDVGVESGLVMSDVQNTPEFHM